MRPTTILTLIIICLVLGGAILKIRSTTAQGPTPDDNPYPGLRAMALETPRDALGLPQPKPATAPWGVVMEIGFDRDAMTVVAFADGNASIYFSNGNAFIGGFAHEAIRDAALAMVQEAARHVARMKRAEDLPLPTNGQTIFYLRTDDGVLTAAASEQSLGEQQNDLWPLFYAGHDIITQYRLLDQGR